MEKDKGTRCRIIVAACFWLGFLTDGIQYSFGLLFIELLREFKKSKATTAWVSSLFIGWLILGPGVSWLINKYGCRTMVLVGAILSSIGLFASVFSTSVYFLCVSYGCFGGLGFLLMSFAKRLIIVNYFERKRSTANGIATCGSGIGSIVFSPLTKWLIDMYGWRGTLLVETGLMLNCLACGLVMRPFEAQSEKVHSDERMADVMDTMQPLMTNKDTPAMHIEDGAEVIFLKDKPNKLTRHCNVLDTEDNNLNNCNTGDQQKANRMKIKYVFNLRLLRNRRMLFVILATLPEALSYYTPFTFLPDMVIHKGWSRAQAAWLLTAIGIVNTICRVPIGRVADFKCVNRVLGLAGSYAMMGVFSIAMPFTDMYEIMMAVCVLFGVFVAGYGVLYPVAIADLFDEKDMADVIGISFLIFGMGSLVSGPVSGALFDSSGDYKITFVVAGVEFILSAMFSCVLFCISRQDMPKDSNS